MLLPILNKKKLGIWVALLYVLLNTYVDVAVAQTPLTFDGSDDEITQRPSDQSVRSVQDGRQVPVSTSKGPRDSQGTQALGAGFDKAMAAGGTSCQAAQESAQKNCLTGGIVGQAGGQLAGIVAGKEAAGQQNTMLAQCKAVIAGAKVAKYAAVGTAALCVQSINSCRSTCSYEANYWKRELTRNPSSVEIKDKIKTAQQNATSCSSGALCFRCRIYKY
jgi:hypothetical protein